VRRKLKPTHVERSVFGEGDGSDIQVHDTRLGRLVRSTAGNISSR